VPFLMSNDWPSMSSMADMASVELVRGPSSALYGTNAFNGVLVLTTKQPRYSQGGAVQLTAGELSTLRGDVRWSGGLAENSYLKVHGSYTQSDDFYRARNVAFDERERDFYRFCASTADTNCIRREAAPLQREDDELWLAGIRFDQYVGNSFFTVEGGTSKIEGPVIQTGIGRVQVTESERPWARVNYSHPRFNVLAYTNQRDAPVQRALASGANLILDEENWAVELQGNMDFAGTKGRLIGGASYKDEEIDTTTPAGVSTLTRFNPVGAERTAFYGQAEYAFTPKFKGVVAARWDDSDLHDSQVSPKVALVIAPTPNQTVRLTYNQAFQSPNYSEFFLRVPAGAPITGFAGPLGGLDPTLRSIPILAFGNPGLDVEEIKTWEVGYSGILGGNAFLTLDYYNSELENFVTDLLPGVNPEFAPYAPPSTLPAPVQTAILNGLRGGLGPNFPGLTRLSPTTTALVLSYANAGAADTQGVDAGLNLYLNTAWTLGFAYSWFDFELKDAQIGDRVLPNSPENSGSVSLAYSGARWDGSVAYRYVEEFDWAAGVFVGTVPQYDLVDVNFGFDVTDNFRVALNVANAFDDEHFQAFGGDVIGRRALGSVTFSW
jgi:outer membrane receptor protein involved in Fe transport